MNPICISVHLISFQTLLKHYHSIAFEMLGMLLLLSQRTFYPRFTYHLTLLFLLHNIISFGSPSLINLIIIDSNYIPERSFVSLNLIVYIPPSQLFILSIIVLVNTESIIPII